MSLSGPVPVPVEYPRRVLMALAAVGALAAAAPSAAAAPAPGHASRDTRFYVPPPPPGSVQQVKDLVHQGDLRDAVGIARMVTTPQAVVPRAHTDRGPPVRAPHRRRLAGHAVPVLVAYNLPFRDCAQYSAGGATDTNAYLAGSAPSPQASATVSADRDPRARQPRHHPATTSDINGNTGVVSARAPGATPQEPYRALNGAVDALARHHATEVYLSRHPQRMALRRRHLRSACVRAGRVAGRRAFFLNVSNFQTQLRVN